MAFAFAARAGERQHSMRRPFNGFEDKARLARQTKSRSSLASSYRLISTFYGQLTIERSISLSWRRRASSKISARHYNHSHRRQTHSVELRRRTDAARRELRAPPAQCPQDRHARNERAREIYLAPARPPARA